MKSNIILVNWILSFISLCIDTEKSSFLAVMIVFVWFLISTVLFLRAQKRGSFKKIEKRFKINEL